MLNAARLVQGGLRARPHSAAAHLNGTQNRDVSLEGPR